MSKVLITIILIIVFVFAGLSSSKVFATIGPGEVCCNGSNLSFHCTFGTCSGDSPELDIGGDLTCGTLELDDDGKPKSGSKWGTCPEGDDDPKNTPSNGGVILEAPKECCKLNQDLTIDKETLIQLYGGKTVATCDVNNRCILGSKKTVGPPNSTCSLLNLANNANQLPDIQMDGWGVLCMLNSISAVTNWLFIILTIIVTLMVIFGAFNLLTSAGDPKKTELGKKTIMYAIIGLAIALIAKIIPSVVKFIVGV